MPQFLLSGCCCLQSTVFNNFRPPEHQAECSTTLALLASAAESEESSTTPAFSSRRNGSGAGKGSSSEENSRREEHSQAPPPSNQSQSRPPLEFQATVELENSEAADNDGEEEGEEEDEDDDYETPAGESTTEARVPVLNLSRHQLLPPTAGGIELPPDQKNLPNPPIPPPPYPGRSQQQTTIAAKPINPATASLIASLQLPPAVSAKVDKIISGGQTAVRKRPLLVGQMCECELDFEWTYRTEQQMH